MAYSERGLDDERKRLRRVLGYPVCGHDGGGPAMTLCLLERGHVGGHLHPPTLAAS